MSTIKSEECMHNVYVWLNEVLFFPVNVAVYNVEGASKNSKTIKDIFTLAIFIDSEYIISQFHKPFTDFCCKYLSAILHCLSLDNIRGDVP